MKAALLLFLVLLSSSVFAFVKPPDIYDYSEYHRYRGDFVDLTWWVYNVSAVSVYPTAPTPVIYTFKQGDVPSYYVNGWTVQILGHFESSVTYTLTATNDAGSSSRTLSLVVHPPPVCGNGVCEPPPVNYLQGESATSCPADCCDKTFSCGAWGACSGSQEARSCSNACGESRTETRTCSVCGNGVCEAIETVGSCFQDCCSREFVCFDWGACSNVTYTRPRSCSSECGGERTESEACVPSFVCTPEWQCADAGTRRHLNADCTYSDETACEHGCDVQTAACKSAPVPEPPPADGSDDPGWGGLFLAVLVVLALAGASWWKKH